VRLLGHITEDGYEAIVMELLGPSLLGYMSRRDWEPLRGKDVNFIARQLIEAVACIFAPENR